MFETEDRTIHKVIINKEERYSIWPADREIPLGWKEVGKTGTKDECEAYITEVWTDRRPLSLRKKIEEMERQRREAPVATDNFPRETSEQVLERVERERAEEQNYNWRQRFEKS